ncbi:hypothetical protein SDRG_10941 [Saprolegnia diclina VS20]|uniref:Uncharacterized protein n=1 Tax=Saprolegnia diclina (strain VS20) TaxID=1156394 RepID=T0Q0G5_SAPDV|nr:hypothetical protein SDRG_10941 [Saprolegnia diclina VS20]EQC31339.1 hypothetical protein SDRG_10941 [Saprolegnia diclina VS20]|eukprot:XP_008615180.1 hypothetical protein SDRG_10941 [Saprolegnia diclina VS20]
MCHECAAACASARARVLESVASLRASVAALKARVAELRHEHDVHALRYATLLQTKLVFLSPDLSRITAAVEYAPKLKLSLASHRQP